MASLIYIILASLISAEALFDCSKNDYNTEAACIATKWCVWNTVGTPNPGCIADPCLKYVAAIDDTDAAACNADSRCNLYYITDIHDCSSGEIVNQTDLFCRSNNDILHKQPLDACFYQDLKNRYTTDPPAAKCANLEGNIACSAVGSGNTFYCDSTGTQTCNEYLEDNDLPGFCGCLKPDRCNLYPGCAISRASGGPCVADPCAYATVATTCVGNIAEINSCIVVNVQQVVNNALVNKAYCVSADNSTTVKKNDYNPCYYGISQTVSYPTWNVNKTSDCQTVTEQNKCADIASVACEAKAIAAGWFSSAQGNYCSDNQGRNIPSPDGASLLQLPWVLLLLAAVAIIL